MTISKDKSFLSFMSSPENENQVLGLPEMNDQVSEAKLLIFENQIESLEARKARHEHQSRTKSKQNVQLMSLDRRVWLNTRDAADYLGTTIGGLRNRVYRGQLKPHKPFGVNGRNYFKRADLDRLMERS